MRCGKKISHRFVSLLSQTLDFNYRHGPGKICLHQPSTNLNRLVSFPLDFVEKDLAFPSCLRLREQLTMLSTTARSFKLFVTHLIQQILMINLNSECYVYVGLESEFSSPCPIAVCKNDIETAYDQYLFAIIRSGMADILLCI